MDDFDAILLALSTLDALAWVLEDSDLGPIGGRDARNGRESLARIRDRLLEAESPRRLARAVA